MAALVFPAAPSVGDVYPANPGTSGVTQYKWDGAKWNAVNASVSLGAPNQGAFNAYKWPATTGAAGELLTTDGSSNLSWGVPASPTFKRLDVLGGAFDGVTTAYTLVEYGTTTSFTPVPSSNILVVLGGVPQIPVDAYSVAASTITFTAAPAAGTTFYAVSSTLA